MNNGMMATIVRSSGSKSNDIQFEDGAIVYNRQYGSFARGTVKHPLGKADTKYQHYKNIRLGESKICKNGQKATIIDYENYDTITVAFENGKKWITSYRSFKSA